MKIQKYFLDYMKREIVREREREGGKTNKRRKSFIRRIEREFFATITKHYCQGLLQIIIIKGNFRKLVCKVKLLTFINEIPKFNTGTLFRINLHFVFSSFYFEIAFLRGRPPPPPPPAASRPDPATQAHVQLDIDCFHHVGRKEISMECLNVLNMIGSVCWVEMKMRIYVFESEMVVILLFWIKI